MTPNQFIRIMFTDKRKFKDLTLKEKGNSFFMFNRIIARLYPLKANLFNVNGIDTALASTVWFNALSEKFSYIPNKLEPNWNVLKKEKDINKSEILKDFSSSDKNILLLYPELIEAEIALVKENLKNEKSGNIKVLKK